MKNIMRATKQYFETSEEILKSNGNEYGYTKEECMTIIYDVILNRGSKALPDVTVFYDEDREKGIDEMGKYVKRNGFTITTKNGEFTIRDVVLREREATGKELSRTSYCKIFNTVTGKRL